MPFGGIRERLLRSELEVYFAMNLPGGKVTSVKYKTVGS